MTQDSGECELSYLTRRSFIVTQCLILRVVPQTSETGGFSTFLFIFYTSNVNLSVFVLFRK